MAEKIPQTLAGWQGDWRKFILKAQKEKYHP
jgi:hypothetical protein